MRKFYLLAVAWVALVTNADARAANLRTAFELRCGWFSNPTPGNAWLDDKDGRWIIGTQGGHQANGDWPQFKPAEWVRTNIDYGYGCACLRLRVDHATFEVLDVRNAQAQPLSACRADRALEEPK